MKSQRKINEEQVFFALKLRSHYSIQQNCAEKRTWWPQTVCRCDTVRNMLLVWRQTCVSIICVQICDNPCVNMCPINIEHLLRKQIHSKIFANIKLPYKYTYTAYTHPTHTHTHYLGIKRTILHLQICILHSFETNVSPVWTKSTRITHIQIARDHLQGFSFIFRLI